MRCDRRRIPRRNRRGLIEATPRLATAAIRPSIPRRNRRGLIEAGCVAIHRAMAIAKFPGEIAGASLKHGPVHVLDPHGAWQFPGEIAGASLKRGSTVTEIAGARKFPGEIAGASLKRRIRTAPGAPGAEFPGEIAGASLKRLARERPRGHHDGKFPGEIAGASLKHRECNGGTITPPTNSPAKSPGPH